MDKEFASLLKNGMWELEKLLDGFKALPMKWVYKIKRDAEHQATRRAWWQRGTATQEIDFKEVYASVSKHTTLRVLLAVVTSRNMELHELDVKTAFLNGEWRRRSTCNSRKAMKKGGPGTVCHLQKTLYGLRQAPRAWHMRLQAELEALGFRALETDPALSVKEAGRQATYVLVWVDNILVAGLDREKIAAVKRLLGACWMFEI